MTKVAAKVAVVTGAGSGIGRAIALALLAEGYQVALAGRTRERLDETLEQAGDKATNAIVVPTDVRDEDAVRALFDQTVEAFGRVDLLFNNAGIFTRGASVDEVTTEDWMNSVETNLTGSFLCLREAFRRMRQQNPQGGRIINNGSISAHVPRPGSITYTTTKHAMNGMTKTASLDGRRFNICVGQIDIGNVESAMTEAMKKGVPQPNGDIMPEAVMSMDNVVKTVLHMDSLPLDANMPFVTVMANQMPFMGRG